MSSSLRDEIIAELRGNMPAAEAERVADRILAIPEIAEALIIRERQIDKLFEATGAVDGGDTGIDTGPGSGNTPEDQRRDVGGLPSISTHSEDTQGEPYTCVTQRGLLG